MTTVCVRNDDFLDPVIARNEVTTKSSGTILDARSAPVGTATESCQSTDEANMYCLYIVTLSPLTTFME